MVKGPAAFFVHRYRTYGPVCRLSIFGEQYVLISGVEAAIFMGTRAGKDCLRSKEFWQGRLGEYGAKRMLTGEDGDSHRELRDIMRNDYSKQSIKGSYTELVAITAAALTRDWPVGTAGRNSDKTTGVRKCNRLLTLVHRLPLFRCGSRKRPLT